MLCVIWGEWSKLAWCLTLALSLLGHDNNWYQDYIVRGRRECQTRRCPVLNVCRKSCTCNANHSMTISKCVIVLMYQFYSSNYFPIINGTLFSNFSLVWFLDRGKITINTVLATKIVLLCSESIEQLVALLSLEVNENDLIMLHYSCKWCGHRGRKIRSSCILILEPS